MNPKRPAGLRAVFVDSSAYLALRDPRDARWSDAVAIVRRLTTGSWRLVTTNFVVAETYAGILQRRNRFESKQFLTDIYSSPGTEVVRVDGGDEREAHKILYRYEDKDFSLVDALSFAVMQRLQINRAFTFDDHFRQYGRLIVLDPRGD